MTANHHQYAFDEFEVTAMEMKKQDESHPQRMDDPKPSSPVILSESHS
jgi:hypothetical protein